MEGTDATDQVAESGEEGMGVQFGAVRRNSMPG